MKHFILLILLCLICSPKLLANEAAKIVIAHRGASGYLPEHSMEAKAMAYAMGADYIEQDLVMTKDDQLVVLHDHFLDRVTNVAQKFPNRARKDGRYYVIDFTLDEIRTLSMTEGFTVEGERILPVYSQRFPLWKSTFRVHTFSEEIELIQGLNKSTGRDIGIYPEIKSPAFHLHNGKDISRAVLNVLKHYQYDKPNSRVYLQSFDPDELRRIKSSLMPALKMNIRLVQLIAMTNWRETPRYIGNRVNNYNYDWMFEETAMEKIASYADGIGPWKSMLVKVSENKVKSSGMIESAQKAGLKVHPYTFRADKGRIPAFARDFEDLVNIYLFQLNVDGVFTDFPDRAISAIRDGKNNNDSKIGFSE